MATLDDAPMLLSSDASHTIATWRGHVLATWTGEPPLYATSRLARELLMVCRARPGRCAYVAVLHDAIRLPSSNVRRIYSRLGKELGRDINCIAAVVEGQGFAASAMRAAVTGLGLASSAMFPLKCFDSLKDAATWVGPRVVSAGGNFGTRDDVEAAFAQIRRPAEK